MNPNHPSRLREHGGSTTRPVRLKIVHALALVALISLSGLFLAGPAMEAGASSEKPGTDPALVLSQLPVEGMVTMIDLGATECIPCKMMAPILKKLETAYRGKAAIVFIDVWKNREQAGKYGIRAIPTQIFFNKNGVEVFRHLGFMDEASIVAQLSKMGVEKPDI